MSTPKADVYVVRDQKRFAAYVEKTKQGFCTDELLAALVKVCGECYEQECRCGERKSA